MTQDSKPSPIEVFLTQRNMEVTGIEAHEDETIRPLEVNSLSLRAAEREVTGYYIAQGYAPIGTWAPSSYGRTPREKGDIDESEVMRRFKLKGENL